MKMHGFCALLIFCLCFSVWAHAAETPAPLVKIIRPPVFRLPIDCTIGTDCWILNYPDAGPDNDKTAIDPGCTARTYDGHKGTDIAIPDAAAMKRGVDVLAARDGTVMRVRDGEDDHFPIAQEQLDKIRADKKECGNAVLIQHEDGWQTMYCHMKRDSIVVKPKQAVKAGDKLGQVGASGMTQFPHIHIGIIHNADVVNPFSGHVLTDACDVTGASLFEKSAHLFYEPIDFMKLGFAQGPITLDALDQGTVAPEDIAADSDALVFYAVMLGVRTGDKISLSIEGPDGKIFSKNSSVMDKDRARQMLYVGRKIPKDAPLAPGLYTGTVEVLRKNKDNEEEKFSKVRAIRVE